MIDLGIAKFRFELGAGGGNWEYGNGGYYYFDDERTGIIIHTVNNSGLFLIGDLAVRGKKFYSV